MMQAFMTAYFACWLQWWGVDSTLPFHRTMQASPTIL